ncbi:hypothetical protein GUITHDRAFT_117769 [Guillardia theta CCMP2712]|uniref:Uncharacterized protein n=1 Tax=Guillardia theta (strain CCMP2712) TaxID=905079 RepID=L1IJJ3_GUITC|nr:hypothetical protein GUITHDRAFT_117769 [Guillardia theta CCMP2712]EKX36099.1 hypothetical protein GUITHDRAFT_117769 [Guillardia theta CCMP2712]|eukprot:XP_005823079.1 hypothetical protein GUITHDRAFT_117769 [Guillardia theta CCMP2712]
MATYAVSSVDIVQSSRRALNDIVKLDMMMQENSGRIIEVWMQYHSTKKDAAASVLSRPEYDTLTFRIKKCPIVILPVHRPEGYQAFLVKFDELRAFVTTLEEYKEKGENAEPVLAWSLHPDMLEEKGMALARADFVASCLTKDEANKLIADLTYCYVDSKMFKEVMKLNQNPTEFDWNDFVQKLGQRHTP